MIQLLMCYPSLASRLDEDARALLLDPQRPETEVLAHLVAACDGIQGAANFAAFSEQLAQTPFADVYAGARTAVLKEDIEEEPAALEFEGAIHKLLADPLQRELETLQAEIIAGHADENAKARFRWLVAEVQRRRQMGWRPATAEG